MTVKERLISFIKYKNLSHSRFEKLVGLSNGYVNNIRVSIQPGKIERIVLQFPELNTGWLLTGEGEMLKSENNPALKEDSYRERYIRMLEDRIEEQKLSIERQGKCIDIYQTKTSARVIIPLTARMELILKKYEGRLPYIHENYVNEYIKTVAFACGIKDTITWIAQDRGMKHEVSAPKWSLVTCHTGRRSAATNMYLAGIKTLDIMKITGHKTERNFLKYIKVSEAETAQSLAKHPYFSNLKIAK